MKTAYTVLTAALGIVLVAGMLYAGPASAQPLNEYGQQSDLAACEWDCKLRYGLWPLADELDKELQFRGYYGYSTCIQKCNRTYWQNFDKDEDKLLD
ncbi:MAG: hypothetical protein P8182_01370 [Deltaproteobacteria bacterium]